MLKKIFKKGGMIMVFNDNQTMDECYFVINNYHEGGGEKWKKEYYITKGLTYPQLN